MHFSDELVGRTRTALHTCKPIWNSTFAVDVTLEQMQLDHELELTIWDLYLKFQRRQFLGEVSQSFVSRLIEGNSFDKDRDLLLGGGGGQI